MPAYIEKKLAFCLVVGFIFRCFEYFIAALLKLVARNSPKKQWMKKHRHQVSSHLILGVWNFFIIFCLYNDYVYSLENQNNQNVADKIQMIFMIATLSTITTLGIFSTCLAIISCFIVVVTDEEI